MKMTGTPTAIAIVAYFSKTLRQPFSGVAIVLTRSLDAGLLKIGLVMLSFQGYCSVDNIYRTVFMQTIVLDIKK